MYIKILNYKPFKMKNWNKFSRISIESKAGSRCYIITLVFYRFICLFRRFIVSLNPKKNAMVLELNEVLIEGAPNTVSMLAEAGQMTCLTGGSALTRSRLLLAMMGLEPLKNGFVCIDGEPLTERNTPLFRSMMAYAPDMLKVEGQVRRYEPPSVQDVFDLKANRDVPISNGILAEEMKRTGAPAGKARLLAVAVLRRLPILLVDNPAVESAMYLHDLAQQEHIVVVTTQEQAFHTIADQTIEI